MKEKPRKNLPKNTSPQRREKPFPANNERQFPKVPYYLSGSPRNETGPVSLSFDTGLISQ
jgi:hypothetical protein